MERAVNVDPSVLARPPAEVGLLLGEKAGLADVALPVLEVVRAVAYVEVTGGDSKRVPLGQHREA